MEEIVYRLRMNCPLLTKLDLSNMEDKWTERTLLALRHNTTVKKLKVKDGEKRHEWLRAAKNAEVYFVNNFVAIEGGEDVIYHIYKGDL
jgi:hypothetical protein